MNDFNRTPNQPEIKKVDFMIWGNPQANAGYSPIFYFNNPRFTPPADSSPGGMTDNDYYFVVNISAAFTNIVLIQNNVKSAGSSRDARLKFAMSIPKGMRLVNNKTGIVSPFDLLFKMRNMFIARYMEPIRGGVGHSFLANIPPNAAGSPELQAILESYSYRTAMLPHRPMSGNETAFLQLPTDKISEILTDLQYPEFAPFKEIVIAERGSLNPVVGISAIPRRPNWRLFVNGRETKLQSSDPDVVQTYSVTDKNPKYYDNTSIKFKISDARVKGCNGVTIDEANEIIRVKFTSTPKKRSYKIQVFDSSSNKEINIPQGISFKVGDRNVMPEKGLLKLQGEQIDKSITAAYQGNEFMLKGCNIGMNIITINLIPKKRVENNAYASNTKSSDKPVKIQFSIKGKDVNKYTGKVIVSKRDGQSEILYKTEPKYIPSRSGDQLDAEITIPAIFANSGKLKFLSNDNNKYYEYDGLPKQRITIPTDYFKSRKSDNTLLILILTGIVALILGCAGGYFIKSWLDKPKEATPSEVTEDGKVYNFDELGTDLQREDLKFSTIKEYNDKRTEIKGNKEILEKYDAEFKMLDNYIAFLNAYKGGDIEGIKSAASQLNSVHSQIFAIFPKGIIKDGRKQYFQAEGITNVTNAFKDGETFQDFKAMKELLYSQRIDIGNPRTEGIETPQPPRDKTSAKTRKPHNPGTGTNTEAETEFIY